MSGASSITLPDVSVKAPAPTTAQSTQPAQSYVRRPRAKITANGTPLRWERVEVVLNANQQGNYFFVELPLFDPMAPYDWGWWSNQAQVEIQIQVGFADQNENLGQLSSLIQGQVEKIELSPVPEGLRFGGRGGAARGPMLEISGNGYESALINSPLSDQFTGGDQSLTSLQVIQQIVANHPQITLNASALSDNVGSVYDASAGRLMLHRSEWDEIQAVAAHENWKVQMVGTTLYVQPANSIDTQANYRLFYYRAGIPGAQTSGPQSNCEMLRLGRSLALAQGAAVDVMSYSAETGNDPAQGSATTGTGGNAGVVHTENIPGLSQDQANKAAQSRAAQIANWEREIEFAIPGDPTITLQTIFALSGTGTAFDQTYYSDSIRHILDVRMGYSVEVVARSASQGVAVTQSQAAPTSESPDQDYSGP